MILDKVVAQKDEKSLIEGVRKGFTEENVWGR